MEKRKLQIDVLGLHTYYADLIKFNLIIDGRSCQCYMSKSNYYAFLYDGVFLRDGKNPDSAGILNTTKVFKEIE